MRTEAGALRGLRPLVLVDTIDVGGAGKVALQAIEALAERGVPVTVANFAYPGRPSAFSAAVRARGLDFVELTQAHRLDWRCVGALAERVRERGVNLVESHSFKAHLAAWRLRARTDGARPLPWIAYAHGWTAETLRVRAYNALERRLLVRPDHVCAPAGTIAERLRRAGRQRPVSVVHNGLDASPAPVGRLERAQARLALGVPADAFVVACVARLSHEKGVDVLVRAADATVAPIPKLVVLVAGDGPDREPLCRLHARFGLGGRVRLLGQVRDVRRVLACADLLALPSRSEGLPNAALEALDAGLPIVATAVGALPELVREGVTGWLVPPDDPVALATALRRAAATPQLAAMGARGRSRVLPTYSAQARLERLFALYGELLADGPDERAEVAA